jgi:hypothetical protein
MTIERKFLFYLSHLSAGDIKVYSEEEKSGTQSKHFAHEFSEFFLFIPQNSHKLLGVFSSECPEHEQHLCASSFVTSSGKVAAYAPSTSDY